MLEIFDVEKFLKVMYFCTSRLNHNYLVNKIIFDLKKSKFSDSNFTNSNNTTPTSAHVKKQSDSSLKYAASATPT